MDKMIIYCISDCSCLSFKGLFSEGLQSQRATGQQGKAGGTLGSPGMRLSLLFPQDLDTPWGSKAMIHPESEPEASSIRKTQLVCLKGLLRMTLQILKAFVRIN